MAQSRDGARLFRERGYRLTPQRLLVLDAIEKSEGHISAEEIYSQIKPKYPPLNISTVYRTLELLKETKLVTETELGDGRMRYHAANKGHHHHLVCRKCGAITDMDESLLAPLEEQLLKRYNFRADLRHVAIFGHCARCSDNTD